VRGHLGAGVPPPEAHVSSANELHQAARIHELRLWSRCPETQSCGQPGTRSCRRVTSSTGPYGACTEANPSWACSAGGQWQLRAWAVNPSRKLRRFESFTRHTVHDKAPHQLKQPGGAFLRRSQSGAPDSLVAANGRQSLVKSIGVGASLRRVLGEVPVEERAERLGCRDIRHHGA
jgi:hypothetical protein